MKGWLSSLGRDTSFQQPTASASSETRPIASTARDGALAASTGSTATTRTVVPICDVPTNQDATSPANERSEFATNQGMNAGEANSSSSIIKPTRGGKGTAAVNGNAIPEFSKPHFANLWQTATGEAERRIVSCARSLAENINEIAKEASMKDEKWKMRLLDLFEGNGSGGSQTDVDALLESSQMERFAQKCLETDLVPTLIQCLRLLRLLEIQHASNSLTTHGKTVYSGITTTATEKVRKLLLFLLTDPKVGNQLRSNLVGLLTLPCLSYPASGIHIASAASDAILELSYNCLSTPLISYIHDKRMIVIVTDDIKELCGMTSISNSSVKNYLFGKTAEEAGLWVVALKAVVTLVTVSSNNGCSELINDFDEAGGYHVLGFSILNSSHANLQKLLELLMLLVYCSTSKQEILPKYDDQPQQELSDNLASKLAKNFNALEIFVDLIIRSIPYITSYGEEHSGKRPVLNAESLRDLVRFSVEAAIKKRRFAHDNLTIDNSSSVRVDLSSELLVTTLQLYSDHSRNYSIVEPRYNILSHYILAFPTFKDVSTKVLILKTLEYVCTGLVGADVTLPLTLTSQIYFALCRILMKKCSRDSLSGEKTKKMMGEFVLDLTALCDTIEKLFPLDESLFQVMCDCGLLDEKLKDYYKYVSSRRFLSEDGLPSADAVKSTTMDQTYVAICRILKLVISQNEISPSRREFDRAILNNFLACGAQELGAEACTSSLSVFEAMLSVGHSSASVDMNCIIKLIRRSDEISLSRIKRIFQMLKEALGKNAAAQDSFRICTGFEAMIQTLYKLEGLRNCGDPNHSSILSIIETMILVYETSTTHHPALNNKSDRAVTNVSQGENAAERNRLYLRRSGFYRAFATAVEGTGIFTVPSSVDSILNTSLTLLDPTLRCALEKDSSSESSTLEGVTSLRDPDATRLVIALSSCLPQSAMVTKGRSAFDEILRLCAPDMASSTLPLICGCSITKSLTSFEEFGYLLEDRTHILYSRCMLLLRRVAAFRTSYEEFISLLRFMAGPMLYTIPDPGVIELPVITSVTRISVNPETVLTQERRTREADFCTRLETLCIVAERGDPVARCILGGDSLNTVALYMQQIPVSERLSRMSQEGRLKFIEISQIDANKKKNAAPSVVSSHDALNAEKVWPPLISSGFTFSAWLRLASAVIESSTGSLFLLDISCSSGQFLSFWYDLQHEQICVLSSSSRGEPNRFPQTHIIPDVWHHILLTYQPTKRPMLGRKAVVSLYVDGSALSEDVKVESINLPPTASVHIGAPNPKLAASGIVRGLLPFWELGPSLMTGTVMTSQDATAIYAAGPEFDGIFWGICSQRSSFSACATAFFSMLASSGEEVSVAVALRKRQVPEAESSGTYMRERGFHDDSLSSFGLQCSVNPDDVIFGFRPSAWATQNTRDPSSLRQLMCRKLINIARINEYGNFSEDGTLYGSCSIILPQSFSSNLYWAGGPNLLLPLVNAAETAGTLSLALRLIRVASRCHPPNLESLQAGGGYRILGMLLRQKGLMDSGVLDQCFAFAIHGFNPKPNMNVAAESPRWVFSDLDAMKYLLLNHQWDLSQVGPELPTRFISFLNGLLTQENIHAAFNARRLHVLGIVQWVLHLMLEVAELYDSEEMFDDEEMFFGQGSGSRGQKQVTTGAVSIRWRASTPSISAVAGGDDPENELLRGCKTLLRRTLTHMLTPVDVEATAGATMYTLSISDTYNFREGTLQAGPVARVYLLRLLEELVIDGVNEILTGRKSSSIDNESDTGRHSPLLFSGVVGGMKDQSFASVPLMSRKKKPPFPQDNSSDDSSFQLNHQQAQAFLCAFSGILTPTWFACLLEGCQEEASASAGLRVMMLLIQSSPTFSVAFEQAGGFAPLVLSIPKYSTCPSIIVTMLSQLLHHPILFVPTLHSLEAAKLCEIFEPDIVSTGLFFGETNQNHFHTPLDPSCGIFALLSECLGRNVQLASVAGDTGVIAKKTNEVVLRLLGHMHTFSSSFQEFCRTRDFLEPLSQALCLIYEEKEYLMAKQRRQGEAEQRKEIDAEQLPVSQSFMMWPNDGADCGHHRNVLTTSSHLRGSLKDVNAKETPTERLVGKNVESELTGLGLVQLLRHIISHAVLSGPYAATLLSSMFHSFPIHATPDQVEAFHLVIIEQSKSVIEDALQRGEPFALANCIGVSSVFLDCSIAGFFSSEPVSETVVIMIETLRCISSSCSYASRVLGALDQNMLVAEAAHIARLTCLTALHRSRPMGHYDFGDDDLKILVLEAMAENIQILLLSPNVGSINPKLPSVHGAVLQTFYCYNPPTLGQRSCSLWQSASLARCPEVSTTCSFPDLKSLDQPDIAFVTALLSDLYLFLQDRNNDVREKAVTVVVMLLQHRRNVVCELLVAELSCVDGRIETVDLMRGGGFGALLVQFTAADITGNISSTPGKVPSRYVEGGTRYASFFEWLERNEGQVAAVFHGIRSQALRQGYDVRGNTLSSTEVIEKAQKILLLKLTSQDSSDRTICSVIERSDLVQRIHDDVAESHTLWKRQGFDDFAYGMTQWRTLLRKLKGSRSIWEYQCGTSIVHFFSKDKLLQDAPEVRTVTKHDASIVSQAMQARWKLDLTEGYERQRIRLLPNYEFQTLYNIESHGEQSNSSEVINGAESRLSFVVSPIISDSGDVSDTAALLKEIHISRRGNIYEEDEYDEAANEKSTDVVAREEIQSQNLNVHESSFLEKQITDRDVARPEEIALEDSEMLGEELPKPRSGVSASSYDLITGLLEPGDWPEKSYNVQRCTGLEVRTALLLFCPKALYFIDGFEKTEGDGLEGKINRVEMSTTSFTVRLRNKNDVVVGYELDDDNHTKSGSMAKINDSKRQERDKASSLHTRVFDGEIGYQHRSQRVLFKDVYSVYKRRYHLQPIALEFYDVHRNGILVAFKSSVEREEVLSKVLSSPLPNSIFSSSSAGGNVINYDRFMASLRAKITAEWVNGRMSNFEFIMHLNSFAGRSYNDLTQYPVFPWVLNDYLSENLDLSDPAIYRDFTKPMGAQGPDRAIKFQDMFKELEENNQENPDEFPPYHYATHYSTAGYVLYYMLRLEPFSRLAITLQGGHFDLPDRLFKSISGSWASASQENMQDVRELIPEFFFLSEFLVNSNMFDFGSTQQGEVVHDVILPPWAKGNPKRFIRIHRQALESSYVSKNLHHWIDLIFGYKQRGREAVKAQNVFFHITYEGAVDIDSIVDTSKREAIIAQIHHFGQTPIRLERKPFPQRNVPVAVREKAIDFAVLPSMAASTPPFCMVGAPHRVYLNVALWDTAKLGMKGQQDASVGDICLVRGQLVGFGRTCALILPERAYYRYGGSNNGVSVHVAIPSTRNREPNRLLNVHDGMHRFPITALKPSLNGKYLVTGCSDSTVRVWRKYGRELQLQATLCGHERGDISAIDLSTVFGTIVTGGADGSVIVWDLRRLVFLRELVHDVGDSLWPMEDVGVTSVSINHKSGNILTLVNSHIRLFDINGYLLAKHAPSLPMNQVTAPSCVISTDCPEYMENGVVAVSGHKNGDVMLWGINYDQHLLLHRHTIPDKVHTSPITALRLSGDRNDTILVGDKSGKISVCKTVRLELLNPQELAVILKEVKQGGILLEDEFQLASRGSTPDT